MSPESTIRVNFSKPVPVFPMPGVLLLPNQVIALHIFEERYKQMVHDALDGPGQIAVAVFESSPNVPLDYHGRPSLRPAVCLGQIAQHHGLPDGRYNIALQGVCRAKIVRELPPGDRLYRQVVIEPVGLDDADEEALRPFRERVAGMLAAGPLAELRDAPSLLEHLANDDIPTPAIAELLSVTLIKDMGLKYTLLAEGNAVRRASIVEHELESLADLIRRAEPQRPGDDLPKGCSWN